MALARLIWEILHDNVRYIEQGQEGDPKAKKRRAQKMAQALRKLGYTVAPPPASLPGTGVIFRRAVRYTNSAR